MGLSLLQSELIFRKLKNIELDAHSTEPAIVIKYELEAAVHDSQSTTLASQLKHCQKIVHLKDLNEGVDTSALARHIIKVCPIIPDYRVEELEQILYYLQKRNVAGGSCMFL
ncbi:unnamed protein product [Gongylonema pulchrum]|uniref:FH2 domain-containing protein n=1 Tax=Gongylonema pulchrum TaxID=637853 RepID=A0A183E144_9BILA|nr:unnamed protein product [Gongylonema pulchrum]